MSARMSWNVQECYLGQRLTGKIEGTITTKDFFATEFQIKTSANGHLFIESPVYCTYMVKV